MQKKYRIVMQYENDEGRFVNDSVMQSGAVSTPESILDLGLRHLEQIEILQKIQDSILGRQSEGLKEDIDFCPKCGHKLKKNGTNKCSFSSVFTDHKVSVHRQICTSCKWTSVPSISSLFGTHLHPDLTKVQCEIVANHSYSKARRILNTMSSTTRTVNSTMTLHGVVDIIGNHIGSQPLQGTIERANSPTLIVQADGGHLKSKDPNTRSFEALTAVVYKPENIIRHETDKDIRGELKSKSCAASALADKGDQIVASTLQAAIKEGLCMDTNVIGICDGADNCWKVIESLSEHCQSITKILDWFHITMRFQNLGNLVTNELNTLKDEAKWSLWHGNTDKFFDKIDSMLNMIGNDDSLRKKLNRLARYIRKNTDKVVDYSYRRENGLPFTSNLAECTVESLINQRCKGKQHMQWSREGVNPILQIRAATASNDWAINWENYILGAYQKAA